MQYRSLFSPIQVTIQSNAGHYSVQYRSLSELTHFFFSLSLEFPAYAYLCDWSSGHTCPTGTPSIVRARCPVI